MIRASADAIIFDGVIPKHVKGVEVFVEGDRVKKNGKSIHDPRDAAATNTAAECVHIAHNGGL